MKTACILNHALGSYLRDDLVAEMKQQSYSLSIDASSDTGLSKMKRGNLISIQLSVIEVLSSTSMYGGCLTKNAVERILQMFAAGNSYFRSEEMTEARFVMLRKLY